MYVQELVTRRYSLRCLRCDHAWETTYEVRALHDDAGDHELFYRHGAPVMGPEATPCPFCGGLRVRIIPGHAPAS